MRHRFDGKISWDWVQTDISGARGEAFLSGWEPDFYSGYARGIHGMGPGSPGAFASGQTGPG